jgi:mono/diheme cytochrome c family protein
MPQIETIQRNTNQGHNPAIMRYQHGQGVGGIRQAVEMLRIIIGLNRGSGLAMAVLALALAAPAGAQENLDLGKSGAQMFASNCAICHKSAQALNRSSGPFGLSNFLREHYTTSRESASVLAAYVESLGRAPEPAKRAGAAKRTPKGDDKGKLEEKKLKPGEAKSAKPGKTGKPAGPTISGPKPSEPKASEPKTSEPKTSEPKPSEPKPVEAKPAESNTSEPKPDAAPAAKPDKPEKSD